MKNFFYKLWDRLEKKIILDTDLPAERRKKVTLVMIILLCHFTGVLSITKAILTPSSFIELLMPVIFNIVVGTALVIYFITKRLSIILYPFLFMILFIPVVFQIVVGGFSSQGAVPIIFWSILAPVSAYLLRRYRICLFPALQKMKRELKRVWGCFPVTTSC